LRYLTPIVLACLLGGCASDVAMKDPKTDETTICPGTPGGVNPWSQNYACAAALAAQGWRRVNPPADFLLIPGVY